MKIGIYLAYDPNVVLKKEGLGRYLANLLKGFIQEKHEVSIACPEWMLDAMDELVDEFNLEREKLNFLVSYKRPAVWNIYHWLQGKKKQKAKKLLKDWKIYRRLCGGVESLLSLMVSMTSMTLFVLLILAICLVLLLLSPILFVSAIIIGAVMLMRSIGKKGSMLLQVQAAKSKIIRSGIISKLEQFAYHKMLKNAERDLVRQINRKYRNSVDIWYCPAAFWDSFGDIKGVTAMNVPDLVTNEFSCRYAENSVFVDANNNVSNAIKKGKYFITYSDYVKKTLLENQFGIPAPHIIAIPHAVNRLDGNITFDDQLSQRFGIDADYSTEFSRNVLNTLFVRTINMQRYLRRFNFKDVKYIFYSSQIRPHKNIMTLVKAYEYLLRRKYCNVKLILTGDISSDKELWDYIVLHRLQFDILAFYNVTMQELSALYRCAELVVNPTFYEGGFPFTFGEGMSVGTPSVMSDIPQVREVVEPYGLNDEMLFDPYDYMAMAKKMEYGLKHRDELLKKQSVLYSDMKQRTYGLVANEYVDAFNSFIEQEKEQKHA